MSTTTQDIEDAAGRFVAYFKMSVLAQYDSEPHKYEVERSDFDGKVSLTADYWASLDDSERSREGVSIRFGFRRLRGGEYCVAAFTFDFKQYSAGHLERWLPYSIDPSEVGQLPDLRFENWVNRLVLGSWDVDNNVLARIEELVVLINAVTEEGLGTSLFLLEKNPYLKTPSSENSHAYQDAHKELYGYMLDGLDGVTVSKLVKRAGITPKSSDKTRMRLQASLPRISGSPLWDALKNVSDRRGEAAHRVRPPASVFMAFETFIGDLEDIERGLRNLLSDLCIELQIDAEVALYRRRMIKGYTKIAGPPCTAATICWQEMKCAEGRTIERIELGQREHHEKCHESEVIHMHFTDGSILSIDVHTNACNVSSDNGGFDPSDFNTNFNADFVPPPFVTP